MRFTCAGDTNLFLPSSVVVSRERNWLLRGLSGSQLFFDDFEGEAFVKFHAGSAKDSTNRFCGATVAPDDFAQIGGVRSQLENDNLGTLDYINANIFGVIH